jgi:hypothetical protein
MSEEPVARPAARAVLLDSADRVLLLRFSSEAGDTGWWATPGGGLQPADIVRSGDEFAPRRLADLLTSLLTDGPPAIPVDAGV